MTRYIFITGGVVSSLGKGITSATLGALLQAHGFRVKLRKLDPYLNVDPGTMSPSEHGEVFVTDDGTEGDLDLGHYERFTGINTTQNDSTTTGKIYNALLKEERRGNFLGKTIQIIPHVTNAIKKFILNATDDCDFALIEIGGTVGDIEALPFFEAIRQLGFELGKNRICFIHLTYLPYIAMAGELKTKPTQHSVKTLQSLGIQPDILMCRADVIIPDGELSKISQFCNVDRKNVIPAPNAQNIYQIPLLYHENGLDKQVLEYFFPQNMDRSGDGEDSKNTKNKKVNRNGKNSENGNNSTTIPPIDLTTWRSINKKITSPKRTIPLAVVGKYTNHRDSYKSLVEALNHGAMANDARVDIIWIDSRNLKSEEQLKKQIGDKVAILVPGGFGKDGVAGKIVAAGYARKNNIPYLGICLGMQVAVIEFARNVLGLEDANSTEFDSKTGNPVIGLMTEWSRNGKREQRDENSDLGGTMRLGGYDTKLRPDSLLHKIYGKDMIRERHRHRYEVNSSYISQFEERGLIFSGISLDGKLPECVELKNHKFFVGVQFHPELVSRPFAPAPLFEAFVREGGKG